MAIGVGGSVKPGVLASATKPAALPPIRTTAPARVGSCTEGSSKVWGKDLMSALASFLVLPASSAS